MAATAPLTAGQRLLLEKLAEDSTCIWRSPAGFRIVRPFLADITLTEGTVDALVAASYVRCVESYGRDRGLYEISDGGKLALQTEKRAS